MSDKGELDLTGAKQNTGMWLVKVPKYLSQQWSKASGRGEVGKLRIVKNQGRTEVSFTLNEELANINDIGGKPASVSAPREHPFLLQSVGGQTLTVFTETSVENQSEEKSESGSAGISLIIAVHPPTSMITFDGFKLLECFKFRALNDGSKRKIKCFLSWLVQD
ncbi:general transcription factor IIF subunit 2 [Turdus rufiventris]|nr:general transcription factor IIF subunit 2 [Turdus rufiventris]